MKRFLLAIILLVAVAGAIWYGHRPVQNPDPNHNHADFAVWVDGQKLDFSGEQFMTEELTPEQLAALETQTATGSALQILKQYLHLHDGNGHVIHRHKPGLSVLDFLKSVGVTIRQDTADTICVKFPQLPSETCEGPWQYFSLYTNDPFNGGASFLKDDYVFKDEDKILITNTPTKTAEDIGIMHQQWLQMTDDACMYSKTCPWRGPAPTEGCIADPTVPCVEVHP